MSEVRRFISLTKFFVSTSMGSRGFLAISSFTTAVALILLYLTLSLGHTVTAPVTALAYLYSRLQGFLQVTLTYFLWSVPFATLVVFSTSFLAAFTFSADMESSMKFYVYSLPVRRSTLLLSKYFSSFLISAAIATLYYGIEGISLSILFKSFPPVQFFLSFLLTMLLIMTVISITFFMGMFLNNPTFIVIVFLSTYFIVMETVGIASEILVGNLPPFLISTAGAIVSEVFSAVNLLPFGGSGTISGATPGTIDLDVLIMLIYLITGILSVYILFTTRDIR